MGGKKVFFFNGTYIKIDSLWIFHFSPFVKMLISIAMLVHQRVQKICYLKWYIHDASSLIHFQLSTRKQHNRGNMSQAGSLWQKRAIYDSFVAQLLQLMVFQVETAELGCRVLHLCTYDIWMYISLKHIKQIWPATDTPRKNNWLANLPPHRCYRNKLSPTTLPPSSWLPHNIDCRLGK